MLKDWFEILRQALRLTEDTQENRRQIKELEKDVRDLSQAVAREFADIRLALDRLAAAIERAGEREAAERRIIKLELENHLLRLERGLPPMPSEPPAK